MRLICAYFLLHLTLLRNTDPSTTGMIRPSSPTTAGYEKTDQVIERFWTCTRAWPTVQKFRPLQFTTGTSRVPVNGFKDLQDSDGPEGLLSRSLVILWGYQEVIYMVQ